MAKKNHKKKTAKPKRGLGGKATADRLNIETVGHYRIPHVVSDPSQAMRSIDWLGFPHILKEIVSYCDQNTLVKLLRTHSVLHDFSGDHVYKRVNIDLNNMKDVFKGAVPSVVSR